jgi:hypothetical protein
MERVMHYLDKRAVIEGAIFLAIFMTFMASVLGGRDSYFWKAFQYICGIDV